MDNEGENDANDLISRYKIPLALGFVGLVLLIGGAFSSGIFQKAFIKSAQKTNSFVSSTIKVDVSGEVASPGVYTLPYGARIEEALKEAGGVTSSADIEYVSKSLNLAQKLSDGAKIYVPGTNEAGQSAVVSGVKGAQTSLININNASVDELDKLSGVGAVTAQKIIDARPYLEVSELLSKKALTKAVFDKVKDKVTVY